MVGLGHSIVLSVVLSVSFCYLGSRFGFRKLGWWVGGLVGGLVSLI